MDAEKRSGARRPHQRGIGRKWFWTTVLIGCLAIAWSVGDGHGQSRRARAHGSDHAALTPGDVDRLVESLDLAAGHLDLTASQRQRLAEVLTVLGEELESARADQVRLTAAVETLLRDDALVKLELEAVRAEARDLADRAVAASLDALFEIAGQLDARQRRELVEQWSARR